MSVPVRAFAPGRVNLIGEHTDYNGGLALPFAIPEGITVTVSPGPLPTAPLIRGVFAELRREGIPVPDATVEIASTLPSGAGLSSSAALTVATILALCSLADVDVPPPLSTARLAQRIENAWTGADTGLLDQLAILHGGAKLIDFREPITVTAVELDLQGHRLVVLDSGERRELAASGYNQRRRECREGHPRRLRHVATENDRVRAAVAALRGGDLPRLGAILDASHASLRDDYDVSTPAVERAVARLHDAGAIGARLIGGGFGGHVLGLLPSGAPAPEGAVVVTPAACARLL